MKKIFISAALVASAAAFAQTGKVGINSNAPAATLDIKPNATNLTGTTNEGLLIPRLTKARVAATAAANLTEGTQVYVTDDVLASDSGTFTGTGKGFYYYDATTNRWVKMGSGTAPAPTEPWYVAGTTNQATSNTQNIYQTGDVGIRTSTPRGPLDVSGWSNTRPIFFSETVGGAGLKFSMRNTITDPTAAIPFLDRTFPGTDNSMHIGFIDNGGGFQSGSMLLASRPNVTGSILFSNNGYLQAVLASNGNFGIGNAAAPAAKLDVQGNVRIGDVGAAASASNQVLVRDTTTGIVGYRDAASLAGAPAAATTASNGLTATGSDIQLGGTLTKATTVDQANNNMTFTTGTGQFQVNGTTNLNGGVIYKTRAVTGTLTLQPDDYLLVKTDAGNVTWNMPNTAADGRKICIFNNATSGDISLVPQPKGLYGATIYANSGLCYISFGGVWLGTEGGQ